jgi:hypothetical protein
VLGFCHGQAVAPAPPSLDVGGGSGIMDADDTTCYDMGTDGVVVFGERKPGVKGVASHHLKKFDSVNEAYCMEVCAEDPDCKFVTFNTNGMASWSCMTFPTDAIIVNAKASIVTIGKVHKSALTDRGRCIIMIQGTGRANLSKQQQQTRRKFASYFSKYSDLVQSGCSKEICSCLWVLCLQSPSNAVLALAFYNTLSAKLGHFI